MGAFSRSTRARVSPSRIFRGQFGRGMIEDLADAPALFIPALGLSLFEPDNKALPEPPFQGAVCNHPLAAHGTESG